jgi:hypothetical protein
MKKGAMKPLFASHELVFYEAGFAIVLRAGAVVLVAGATVAAGTALAAAGADIGAEATGAMVDWARAGAARAAVVMAVKRMRRII